MTTEFNSTSYQARKRRTCLDLHFNQNKERKNIDKNSSHYLHKVIFRLYKAAKAAKKSIPQVINLLSIGNDNLPSVQHGHEQLQEQNNYLESILRNKAGEDQNLNDQIKVMNFANIF